MRTSIVAVVLFALVGCGPLEPLRPIGERPVTERDDVVDDEDEPQSDFVEPVEPTTSPRPTDAPPFDLPIELIEHTCEGDEDICEPEGDLLRPWYDVLATWSRVEDETLVVEILFRGTPFLCWGGVGVYVQSGISPLGDVPGCANQEGPCSTRFELAAGVSNWGEVGAEQTFTTRNFFPPLDTGFLFAADPFNDIRYEPNLLRFARDGHLLEMRLPLDLVSADGSPPPYSVFVNYDRDLTFLDEDDLVVTESRGGRANGEEPAVLPTTIFEGDPICYE